MLIKENPNTLLIEKMRPYKILIKLVYLIFIQTTFLLILNSKTISFIAG